MHEDARAIAARQQQELWPHLRPVEEEEEATESEEREEEVGEERHVVALLVTLGNGDVDAVLREDVDEIGVIGEHNVRAAPANRGLERVRLRWERAEVRPFPRFPARRLTCTLRTRPLRSAGARCRPC